MAPWIFLLLSVSASEPEWQYLLTDRETREVRMILYFSSFEDCHEARRVAMYFDYHATCTPFPVAAFDEVVK